VRPATSRVDRFVGKPSSISISSIAASTSTQQRGRDDVFQDYHLRVGEVVSDIAPPEDVPLVEQRLDETEVGAAKFATLTEVSPAPNAGGSLAPSELADRLSLDRKHPALIDHDVFASIYNAGKLALLASWRDRRSAEVFEPHLLTEAGKVRHRVVRIVRDYGMFERRESPQYYPDVQRDSACPLRAAKSGRS
jgi:hypothetical protein